MNNKQTGSALVVTLVILIVLTLLGVSSLSTSVMQLTISGNIQESVASVQKAQSGIDALLSAKPGSSEDALQDRWFINNTNCPLSLAPDPSDWCIDGLSKFGSNPISTIEDDATLEGEVTTMVRFPPENRQIECSSCFSRAGSSTDQVFFEIFEITSVHRLASTGAETRLKHGVSTNIAKAK